MAHCLLALGANQGDRIAQLNQSVALLCGHPQIQLLRCSRHYETLPVGGPDDQSAFLNAAVLLVTTLAPDALLAWTRQVEQQLGRRRTQRWGPRLIDIDILLYDQVIWQSESLVIPHPRMAVRRFVLQPAAEIASEMLHVTTGLTVDRLLSRLDDPPWYVAIAGCNAALCSWLAERAAARCGAQLLSWRGESEAGGDSEAPDRRPADESSGTLHDRSEQVLERLKRQQRLVSAMELDEGHQASWWISDFWLPQTLLEYRNWFRTTEHPEFTRAWQEIRVDAPEPKCVMVLDDFAPQRVGQALTAASSSPTEAAPTPWAHESSAHTLHGLVGPSVHVPVLRAAESDPEWAVIELSAAIDAMR